MDRFSIGILLIDELFIDVLFAEEELFIVKLFANVLFSAELFANSGPTPAEPTNSRLPRFTAGLSGDDAAFALMTKRADNTIKINAALGLSENKVHSSNHNDSKEIQIK
jgi:hypothetical protein